MAHANTDTKQRLIDTALALVWKSSYGSVSVDDICKAADVKKGSFYHFFPSKVDLAIAAMEETSRLSKPFYDEIFSPAHDPVARFERFADFTVEKQEQAAAKYGHVCGCPCASLGSEMACQEEHIRSKFDDIRKRQERYFENALRDMAAEKIIPPDTDIKLKAQEIYAYMIGVMTMARIQNDLASLRRDFKHGLLQMLGVSKSRTKAA